MANLTQQRNLRVVELTDRVRASTSIDTINHAALRSGFAGYPANPRWGASKFFAWKTGRQWRAAIAQGTMVIRETDRMLVPASEREEKIEEEPHSSWRSTQELTIQPLSYSY